MTTRKKNSKRTGTTSSRTRSAEHRTGGRGETSQSRKRELLEDYIYVPSAGVRTSRTKKRKQTTSSQSSIPLKDTKGGMYLQTDSSLATGGKSFAKNPAMQPKPGPKTSNESYQEQCEKQWKETEERRAKLGKSKEPQGLKYDMEIEQLKKLMQPGVPIPYHGEKKGLKHDSEKPALAYIPKAALDAEGKAFGYGARKYEAWNYRNGIAVSRTVSAALRHISQFLDGEDYDKESSAHHLGSARANLAMALDTLANHPELDDRWKGKK